MWLAILRWVTSKILSGDAMVNFVFKSLKSFRLNRGVKWGRYFNGPRKDGAEPNRNFAGHQNLSP